MPFGDIYSLIESVAWGPEINLIKFSLRRKWHSPLTEEEKEACPNGVFMAEPGHKP